MDAGVRERLNQRCQARAGQELPAVAGPRRCRVEGEKRSVGTSLTGSMHPAPLPSRSRKRGITVRAEDPMVPLV